MQQGAHGAVAEEGTGGQGVGERGAGRGVRHGGDYSMGVEAAPRVELSTEVLTTNAVAVAAGHKPGA